ncbi:hypothetical protein EDD22DRAFT_926244 [Suillus occidentalis]|nr:hypothetical protein EDD22DRAFT_926244 [Suillus occidentalis]
MYKDLTRSWPPRPSRADRNRTPCRSDYVNPGLTRRILDVTKPESNIILDFLFHQIAENVDFQPPLGAELNCIRIVTHNAIFDFWPQTRYALKATPHGETLTQILGFRLGNLAS